jgi:hypothetical protein
MKHYVNQENDFAGWRNNFDNRKNDFAGLMNDFEV